MLVYATHTGARDITGRMDDILTRHGSGRSASRIGHTGPVKLV